MSKGERPTELSNFAPLRRLPSTIFSTLMSALARTSRLELVTDTLPASLSLYPFIASASNERGTREPVLVLLIWFLFRTESGDDSLGLVFREVGREGTVIHGSS